MPEQKQPKAPVFNPELKKSIAALKEENSPQKLNAVINELVKSPLLAPAMFDMQGKPAPKPGPDGRIQLPKNTKVSLVMINSPEGKHYYLAFSDWEAAQEWQKQAGKGRPIMALRFDDFAKTIKNKPRSLLNSQIEVLKNLSNDINDLGEKVNLLLKESASSNQDELKKIFEINDINIDKNTQARCNLVQNVLENRKIDTQSYFTLLYEFGKLETDYMDIAIKTILMEE